MSHNTLIQYYAIRMSALSDFSTRVWGRFNWFMTLHLGAFAFIFSNLVKVEHSQWYTVVTIVVSITAVVWTILGYEDFKQMQKYGNECKEIEKVLLTSLTQEQNLIFSLSEQNRKKRGILPFKHSRLLYLFPILVFITWITLSVYLF